MGCVTEVHFWLDDWEHECCGDQRKVGVRSEFRCGSRMSPCKPRSTRPGVAVGRLDDRCWRCDQSKAIPALPVGGCWRPDCGMSETICRREAPLRRETLGGAPRAGRSHRQGNDHRHALAQSGIQKTKDGHCQIGYEKPTVIYNTEKYPGYPPPEDAKLVRFREAVKSGKPKGPLVFKPAPGRLSCRRDGRFEFIIEVRTYGGTAERRAWSVRGPGVEG